MFFFFFYVVVQDSMESDSEAGKLMRNSLWAGLQKQEETLDQIVGCFQGEGGLANGNLVKKNEALLGKWLE